MFSMTDGLPDAEPSGAELAAIEAEWPRIAADLAVLDAEIRALSVGVGLDELGVRRARRRTRAALRAPIVRVPMTGVRFGGEAV